MVNNFPAESNVENDKSEVDTLENKKPHSVVQDSGDKAVAEDEEENEDIHCPDPYYPPIIYLPEVIVNSGEDGEEEIFKKRGRLYR